MPLSRESVVAWIADSSGSAGSRLTLATTINHPAPTAGDLPPPTSPTVPDTEGVDMEISITTSRQESCIFPPMTATQTSQPHLEVYSKRATESFNRPLSLSGMDASSITAGGDPETAPPSPTSTAKTELYEPPTKETGLPNNLEPRRTLLKSLSLQADSFLRKCLDSIESEKRSVLANSRNNDQGAQLSAEDAAGFPGALHSFHPSPLNIYGSNSVLSTGRIVLDLSLSRQTYIFSLGRQLGELVTMQYRNDLTPAQRQQSQKINASMAKELKTEIDALDEEDRCGGWQHSKVHSRWTRKRHMMATVPLGNACTGPIDIDDSESDTEMG